MNWFETLVILLVLVGDFCIISALVHAKGQFGPFVFKERILKPFFPGPVFTFALLNIMLLLAPMFRWAEEGGIDPFSVEWLTAKGIYGLGIFALILFAFEVIGRRVSLTKKLSPYQRYQNR